MNRFTQDYAYLLTIKNQPLVSTARSGIPLGLAGGFFGALWIIVTKKLQGLLTKSGVMKYHIRKAVFAGFIIGTVGVLFPATLFWGEYEIQVYDGARPCFPVHEPT